MFAVVQDEALSRSEVAQNAMAISLDEALAVKAPLSAESGHVLSQRLQRVGSQEQLLLEQAQQLFQVCCNANSAWQESMRESAIWKSHTCMHASFTVALSSKAAAAA